MPLCPDTRALPRLPGALDDPEDLRDFLAKVASDPVVREAVAVSSDSLAATLDKVVSGAAVEPKKLRKAALSAIRYMSRMTLRTTPFGLMAGVAAVRFDDEAKVRIGTGHRRSVRPDMGWLTEVIRSWERDPAVLPGLRLVANDLCFVRGDRLVLPLVPGGEARALADEEQTVRWTGAVRAAMDAARAPIRCADLAGRLSAAFPGTPASVVGQMLLGLIDGEFLLTDLRPPTTEADPVGYVLGKLSGVDQHGGRDALAGVRDALAAYAETAVGKGHSRWRSATAAMSALHASDRPIQVDLGMDAELVLPHEVAAELAQAVSVAWRTAPPDLSAADSLSAYRTEFLERYGPGTLVPVRELLDPHAGLGAPAGYWLPPSHRPQQEHHPVYGERDIFLGGLAQRAAARRARELVLDDDLVERLARRDAGPAGYVEAHARLFADSENDLMSGNFRLVRSSLSMTRPGALFGRFLSLMPELRPHVAGLAGDVVAGGTGAVAAQLMAPATWSRAVNLTQVPEITGHRLAVGVFADRTKAEVLGLDDLAIGASRERFYVVSLRTGEEMVPMSSHALNTQIGVPNAVRLLDDIGTSRTPWWPAWSWGAAARLPFLPRITYGRTVLTPARWLPDPRLTDARTGEAEWKRAFDRWRDEWAVPATVDAVLRDQLLRLDLDSDLGQRLLRDELRKRPGTELQEQPLGGEVGTGWAAGHTVEVVIPMVPVKPRRYPVPRPLLPLPAAAAPQVTRRAFRPGSSWLYAKLYAVSARHEEILARHLPALLERTASSCDRWFFIRYRDDAPHLRFRFHGEPGALSTHVLRAVHDWAAALGDAGLAGNLIIDTYRPEVTRYGGPEAMETAEDAFCADSEAVVEQLVLRDGGSLDLPTELLVAANYLDLTAALHGDGWQGWLRDAYPKSPSHAVFQRHRRAALRLLDTEGSAWPELSKVPGGDQLRGIWQRRAPRLARYGRLIRRLVADGALDSAGPAFSSVLHMHHNRLAGISPATEHGGYAVARGVLQARADRERHLNQ